MCGWPSDMSHYTVSNFAGLLICMNVHTVGSKKRFVFVIATVITIIMKILQENYDL